MKPSIAATMSLCLVACSPAPPTARHTLEEYRADPELRRAQLERCNQDPGTLRSTPDCINAHTASEFEDRTRLRDAPPVGLRPEEKPAREYVDPREQ